MTSESSHRATLYAGVPSINKTVYWRVRFDAHDPVALIELEGGRTVVIIRDVEVARAREQGIADEVHAYEDFEPAGGLSGDREIRAAQATGECLARLGVGSVVTDRSLPALYMDELRNRGVAVEVDRGLGILQRRMKTAEEVEHLRRAQRMTERAIEMACVMIARAGVLKDGSLEDPEARGEALTAETMRRRIETFLGERGFAAEHSIVAGGPVGADCHHRGEGVLRTGEAIIIDVFPRDTETGYHGDCTRMVVHGDVPDEVAKMHDAVARAKKACIDAIRAGVTGEAAHKKVVEVIEGAGYRMGFPGADAPVGFCSMPHGTGHGLGLDLKEPPLIDMGGPELVVGDTVTVEPGVYMVGVGGMRLEDLVIVTEEGCENLNELREGLDWR